MSAIQLSKNISDHHRTSEPDTEIGYLSNDDLASRMLENLLPTIVVDCRNKNENGGHIAGSLFCSEASFGVKEMKLLLDKSIEKHNSCHGISKHKCFVIFYCADSCDRALRCADKFWKFIREYGCSYDISVRVLRGGDHGFIPRYSSDKRLVQNFDSETWNLKEISQG